MFSKYYVFVRESEDDDFIVMEFDELNDAILCYENFKHDSCFDCSIFRRLHHTYTSL